jgi:acid phosphatase (class A)
MLPDRSAAIHARSAEFSHNRIVAGVHYPTDLVTGEIAGTLSAERLLQDRAFRRDLDAARAELVAVLASPEPAAAQAAAAH